MSIDEIIAANFERTESRRHVVRRRTVGAVVAAALGVPWSPRLGRDVNASCERLGFVAIKFNHRHLFAHVRPRGCTDAEAEAIAQALRANPRRRAVSPDAGVQAGTSEVVPAAQV